MDSQSDGPVARGQQKVAKFAVGNRRKSTRRLAERIREEREVLQMLSRRAFVKKRPKTTRFLARSSAKRVPIRRKIIKFD